MIIEDEIEVEELGDDRAPLTGATAGGRDVTGVGDGVARFAVGVLVLGIALGLLFVGFGNDYYEVSYRFGTDPDNDADPDTEAGDDSQTVRHTARLAQWEQAVIDSDGNVLGTETQDYDDDAPLVGVAMERLRWTGYIGTGLATLALLAGLLHRFGALTVSGPAPVMVTFATVLLLVGIITFVTDIPTYARHEWVPGRLDLVPALFTSNADGTVVHDVEMQPLTGFWLHTIGALVVPVGAALTFWDHLVRLKAKMRSLAEEAVVD